MRCAQRYANVFVVEVTAAPEILAGRLSARGREIVARSGPVCAVGARVRHRRPQTSSPSTTAGRAQAAGERFVALLRKAMVVADIAGVC